MAALGLCVGCGLTLDLEPPADGGEGTDFGVNDLGGRDSGAPDLGSADLGGTDLAAPDMARGDLGGEGDAGVCDRVVERCNGLDDDCDDSVDEDFDLTEDLANCGVCGRVCSGLGGTPSCEARLCRVVCDDDRADCDGDPSNGCETDLSRPATCGTCLRSCTSSAPRCVMREDSYTCGAACDDGDTLCAGSCVDLMTSRSHCGACDAPCFLDPHGRIECDEGACIIAECGDSFADCNSDPSDGCEQPLNTATNCGACGNTCGSGTICVRAECVAMVPGG